MESNVYVGGRGWTNLHGPKSMLFGPAGGEPGGALTILIKPPEAGNSENKTFSLRKHEGKPPEAEDFCIFEHFLRETRRKTAGGQEFLNVEHYR